MVNAFLYGLWAEKKPKKNNKPWAENINIQKNHRDKIGCRILLMH